MNPDQMKERQVYTIVQETQEGSADLSALYHARELADCRITAVGVNAERALHYALAAGSDSAVLIRTDQEISAFFRARALAAYLKDRPFDLIVASAFQADEAASEVSMILFEMLGLPAVYKADQIRRVFSSGTDFLSARRQVSDTCVTSRLDFPAGVSVTWKRDPGAIQIGRMLEAYWTPLGTFDAPSGEMSDFVPEGCVPFQNAPVRAPQKVPPEEAAQKILQAVREVSI